MSKAERVWISEPVDVPTTARGRSTRRRDGNQEQSPDGWNRDDQDYGHVDVGRTLYWR